MSTCKGCGAEMKWIMTEAGKNAPVDPDPVKVFVKNEATGAWTVVSGFVPHFATCPNADQFRKGGKSES